VKAQPRQFPQNVPLADVPGGARFVGCCGPLRLQLGRAGAVAVGRRRTDMRMVGAPLETVHNLRQGQTPLDLTSSEGDRLFKSGFHAQGEYFLCLLRGEPPIVWSAFSLIEATASMDPGTVTDARLQPMRAQPSRGASSADRSCRACQTQTLLRGEWRNRLAHRAGRCSSMGFRWSFVRNSVEESRLEPVSPRALISGFIMPGRRTSRGLPEVGRVSAWETAEREECGRDVYHCHPSSIIADRSRSSGRVALDSQGKPGMPPDGGKRYERGETPL